MKKFLSILLAMSMLVSLSACGDSGKDKEDSNENNITSEEFTLDSKWECDYLKIGTCSKWKEDDNLSYGFYLTTLSWYDNESYCYIHLSLSNSIRGKQGEIDLLHYWEEAIPDYKDKESRFYIPDYENYEILDIFTENGQAYIIIGNEDFSTYEIHFETDKASGSLSGNCDIEIAMDMIRSIEFY